jgi:hypothetical protein
MKLENNRLRVEIAEPGTNRPKVERVPRFNRRPRRVSRSGQRFC